MGLPREDWFHRHRISVAEFHRMGEAGVFKPGQRVELIEGEVIDMAPIGPMHAAVVTELARRLAEALAGTAVIRVQQPLHLGDTSEPEPDVSVLHPRAGSFRDAHPQPEDTLLVIEVSDTTLRYDLEVKLPLYARAGIPVAWIVDLRARRIVAYAGPAPGGYSQVMENASSLLVAGTTISLDELF